MVLTSILVYGSLTAIMFFSGKYAAKRQEDRWEIGLDTPFFVPEIILIFLAFCFVCGARWNVGADSLIYLRNYLYLQDTGHFISRYDFELLFSVISKIFALLHVHFFFYFAFWAFLQLFFIFYAFKNERYLYPYFAIIIILGSLFFTWNNGMRQSLAACIFVYSYKFIERRQFLKFLITIILASLIHQSVILCLIFYFILNRDIPFNKYWYLFILIISAFIGTTTLWTTFSQNIEKFFSSLGYGGYEGKTEYMIKTINLGGRSLILLITCAINIWFFPEVYKYFNHAKRVKIFFIMYYIGISGFFLLFSAYVISRITYYFLIFQIPSLAYLFLYAKNNKKLLYYGLIAIFIIYSLANYYLELGVPSESTNYSFFWNHIF